MLPNDPGSDADGDGLVDGPVTYVKDQAGSATYYNGYGWYPSVFTFNNTQAYKIVSSEANTLNITGSPVDIPNTPINVNSGWNWVSYFPSISIDAYTALYSLDLADLDFLKSQDASAIYYEGFGFWPNIPMSPGQGYILQLANSGSLIYPDTDAAASSHSYYDNADLMRSENLIWDVSISDYEFNGSITASVNNENGIEISEQDQLAVFVDGQCRGVVSALYCPIVDENLFPLMVYSNEDMNEKMTFAYYSFIEDKIYEDVQSIEFEADMVIGNAINAYVVNISDEVPVNYSLGKAYPNPFNPSTNIEFSIENDGYTKVSVYNLQGKLIEDLVDDYKSSGNYDVVWNATNYSSGVYFIRMNVNGFFCYSKSNVSKIT